MIIAAAAAAASAAAASTVGAAVAQTHPSTTVSPSNARADAQHAHTTTPHDGLSMWATARTSHPASCAVGVPAAAPWPTSASSAAQAAATTNPDLWQHVGQGQMGMGRGASMATLGQDLPGEAPPCRANAIGAIAGCGGGQSPQTAKQLTWLPSALWTRAIALPVRRICSTLRCQQTSMTRCSALGSTFSAIKVARTSCPANCATGVPAAA